MVSRGRPTASRESRSPIVSADYAMLALQGPRAIEVLGKLIEGEVPGRFRHTEAVVAGVPALVCRTGYTGEDGVELLIEPGGATRVWDALLAAGVAPAGLGARDTLRLEVCYPLYGNDLSTERTPVEAGLKWACALDTDFIGVERLREQAEQGTAELLAPFVFTGQGIPRAGLRGAGRRRAGRVGHERYPFALHGRRYRDGLRPLRTSPSPAPI